MFISLNRQAKRQGLWSAPDSILIIVLWEISANLNNLSATNPVVFVAFLYSSLLLFFCLTL